MERLLSGRDMDFLIRQPGFRPSLASCLRQERRRVFRAYLKALCRDFDRLYYAAKFAALYAPEGVDLCGALARHRAVFYYALMLVETRLLLHRFGLATVDVGRLIGAVEEITTDVHALRPLMTNAA